MTGDTGSNRTLICKMCGKEYHSRGINDPGHCKECEQALREAKNTQIGGPLYGKRIEGNR